MGRSQDLASGSALAYQKRPRQETGAKQESRGKAVVASQLVLDAFRRISEMLAVSLLRSPRRDWNGKVEYTN